MDEKRLSFHQVNTISVQDEEFYSDWMSFFEVKNCTLINPSLFTYEANAKPSHLVLCCKRPCRITIPVELVYKTNVYQFLATEYPFVLCIWVRIKIYFNLTYIWCSYDDLGYICNYNSSFYLRKQDPCMRACDCTHRLQSVTYINSPQYNECPFSF